MDNSTAVRLHLLSLRHEHRRAETIHHREGALRRLGEALPVELLDADETHLHDWQDDLSRRLAVASVRCYTSHVRQFYRWALAFGHIERDPARELHPPKVPRGRARPITEDALRVALACATEPVRTWLVLAAYCGLRAGEIARVTAADVGDDLLDIPDGKGGKSRTVPLPAAVRELLAPYLHVGRGALFHTEFGTPQRPRYVSDRCNALLRDCASGPGVTLHKLRARFATRTYQLSKDPRLVQDLLGHASLATTQVYLAVSAEHGRKVTDRLAADLRPRRPRRPAGASTPRPTSARDTPRAGWATPRTGAA